MKSNEAENEDNRETEREQSRWLSTFMLCFTSINYFAMGWYVGGLRADLAISRDMTEVMKITLGEKQREVDFLRGAW